MASVIVSLVLAVVFGFAAHRASICTVKAVLEILTTRRAYMLLSFAKIVLWVAAITAILVWLAPFPETRAAQVWALSPAALVGGFVFGVGAALNGGCAFYTLSRLGDGHLRMAVSILGFVLGAPLQAIDSSGGAWPEWRRVVRAYWPLGVYEHTCVGCRLRRRHRASAHWTFVGNSHRHASRHSAVGMATRHFLTGLATVAKVAP